MARNPRRIYFDVEFYSAASIRQAIDAFDQYLSASLAEVDDQIAVDIDVKGESAPAVQTILREFANYALDLSLNAHFDSGPDNHRDDSGPAST